MLSRDGKHGAIDTASWTAAISQSPRRSQSPEHYADPQPSAQYDTALPASLEGYTPSSVAPVRAKDSTSAPLSQPRERSQPQSPRMWSPSAASPPPTSLKGYIPSSVAPASTPRSPSHGQPQSPRSNSGSPRHKSVAAPSVVAAAAAFSKESISTKEWIAAAKQATTPRSPRPCRTPSETPPVAIHPWIAAAKEAKQSQSPRRDKAASIKTAGSGSDGKSSGDKNFLSGTTEESHGPVPDVVNHEFTTVDDEHDSNTSSMFTPCRNVLEAAPEAEGCSTGSLNPSPMLDSDRAPQPDPESVHSRKSLKTRAGNGAKIAKLKAALAATEAANTEKDAALATAASEVASLKKAALAQSGLEVATLLQQRISKGTQDTIRAGLMKSPEKGSSSPSAQDIITAGLMKMQASGTLSQATQDAINAGLLRK